MGTKLRGSLEDLLSLMTQGGRRRNGNHKRGVGREYGADEVFEIV